MSHQMHYWNAALGSTGSVFSSQCSFLIHSNPTATFYLPFTRVWELLIGAALAYRVVIQGKSLVFWWGSANLNAWLSFGLLVIANIVINDSSPSPTGGLYYQL